MDNLNISEETLEKQSLEENRVIVRIWTSQANINERGATVGHISIEIPQKKMYWSLWPQQGTNSAKEMEGKGIINPITAERIDDFTYEKDLAFENRSPELVFSFYTLAVYNIIAKYDELCQSGMRWNIVGRLFFANAGSCASSAWELLSAGGINNLISSIEQSMVSSKESSKGSFLSNFFSKNSSRHQLASHSHDSQQASARSASASVFSSEMIISPVVKSPDYIGEILKKAKANELRKKPLTGTIAIVDIGETAVTVSQKRVC